MAISRGVSSVHAGKIDLTNGKWIPVFLRAMGEAEIRRPGYLVNVAANGEIACKACGKYLPWEDPHKHLSKHLAELDKHLGIQKAEGAKKRLENLAKARKARYTPQEEEILAELGL